MNKLLIIVSVFVSILLWACKHTPPVQPVFTPPGSGTNPVVAPGTTPVCFQSEVLPIFINKCASSGCHNLASNLKGYVLDSYDNLFRKDGKYNNNNIKPGDALKSDLYKVLLTGKIMPPAPNPPLTLAQINLIAKWINEGAINTTTCTTSCDSSQFKFSANILPLLQRHCTICHSGTSPESGIDLTIYDNVKPSALNGYIVGVTTPLPGYNKMPKGSDSLSVCERAQIRKWVQSGAPNN